MSISNPKAALVVASATRAWRRSGEEWIVIMAGSLWFTG
jgi:hypothetical protein